MKKSLFFFTMYALCLHSLAQTRTFTVDFSTNNGIYKSLNGVNSVFLDSTNSGYNDIGVKEIRTHAFEDCDYWHYTNGFVNFTTNYTDTATYNSNYNPRLDSNYNFSMGCDSIVNDIINSGFQAYFRLGVSWPDFSNVNCYPCIPLSPPADSGGTTFHSFAAICKKTVEHYTAGWDTGFFYNIPYWEVWNEPDGIFWKGTETQFYQLYREVADSIKSIDTTLRVGTCGLTSNGIKLHDTLFCDNFIHYCNMNNVPLDFYSWHIYKRFNPYSIITGANYVRNTLDTEGFSATKSHITEINAELNSGSVYDSTAKGSAYVASLLMTCQKTSVDKIFWFAGNGLGPLANPDISGAPDLTWKGLGMKSHNTLVFETPIKLSATGDSVIPNVFTDTTNIMIIAGKNSPGTQTDILISNLTTNYDSLLINIHNLPYTSTDIIKIEQFTTQGPNTKYALTSDTVAGSSSLQVHVYSATAPSVYLFKITQLNATAINKSENKNNFIAYPNPSKQTLTFSETLYHVEVFNLYGQNVISKTESVNSISTQELPDGFYFIQSDHANLKFIVKH